MGAISVKNFDISFITRTKEIIEKYEDYSGGYEFTLLINSLLGLLILPKEFSEQNKRKFKYEFLKQPLETFPILVDIFRNYTIDVYYEDGKAFKQKKFSFKSGIKQIEIPLQKISVEQLIRRIRNGIAHMNITPTQFDGKWDGIIIRNLKNYKYCNFETYLTYKELRDFALFIANKYEKTIIR